MDLILASGSEIRASLLRQAGLTCTICLARIDEQSMKTALEAEGATPRDIADTLAEAKARKVSLKYPGALVLGCDQVLNHRGKILSKPETPEDAKRQLATLRGDRHSLLAAVVVHQDGQPLWRYIGTVRMTMRDLSDTYIDDYVTRNWASIRHAVGVYKLEEEGMRLFRGIEGDYFTVLGLPMIPLLSWLIDRGSLPA